MESFNGRNLCASAGLEMKNKHRRHASSGYYWTWPFAVMVRRVEKLAGITGNSLFDCHETCTISVLLLIPRPHAISWLQETSMEHENRALNQSAFWFCKELRNFSSADSLVKSRYLQHKVLQALINLGNERSDFFGFSLKFHCYHHLHLYQSAIMFTNWALLTRKPWKMSTANHSANRSLSTQNPRVP